MSDLMTVVISALVGGVVSYVLAIIQTILTTRAKIDESLRADRIRVYKVLWQKTKILPQYPRSTGVTYEKLANFSEDLRDWYFNEGGIYLSTKARQSYGDAQETIGMVLTQNKAGSISADHYDVIRKKLSFLRTQLTSDLLSRRSASWVM
jgi:hypothetical protein